MRMRSPVLTVARGVNPGEATQAEQVTEKQRTDSTMPESFVASPEFLAASLTGFALIALDVFGPSAHVLAYIDNGAHNWTTSHIPMGVSLITYNKYLSDAPIMVAFSGWCLAGGVSALTGPLRGIRRAAICSAVYLAPWVGGGADVPLVNILKHMFRRIRPSAIAHTTFAFPSGHTTCAVFLFGALFFILLPGALSLTGEGDALDGQDGGKTASPAISVPGTGLMRNALRLSTPVLPLLWVAGGLSTATGRVLGEAHWVSDTMAGACLGCALVSLAAIIDKAAARVQRRLSAKP